MAEQSRLGALISKIAPRRQARQQRYSQILDPLESASEADAQQGADVSPGQFTGAPSVPEMNVLSGITSSMPQMKSGGSSMPVAGGSCANGQCGPQESQAMPQGMAGNFSAMSDMTPAQMRSLALQYTQQAGTGNLSPVQSGRLFNAGVVLNNMASSIEEKEAFEKNQKQVENYARQSLELAQQQQRDNAKVAEADAAVARESLSANIASSSQDLGENLFKGNINPDAYITARTNLELKARNPVGKGGEKSGQIDASLETALPEIRRQAYGIYYTGLLYSAASLDSAAGFSEEQQASAIKEINDDFVRNYENQLGSKGVSTLQQPLTQLSNTFENDTAYLTHGFAATELQQMLTAMADDGIDITNLADEELQLLEQKAMDNGRVMSVKLREQLWNSVLDAREALGIAEARTPTPNSGFAEFVESATSPSQMLPTAEIQD